MSSGNANSPGEDYFNDLARQPSDPKSNHDGEDGPDGVPRPKRIACVVCRKRKLRCDGNKPSCGTCSRLGHECAYDEVRRKSGPKRGYVKALEARLGMSGLNAKVQFFSLACTNSNTNMSAEPLAQVETLLKTQDPPEQDGDRSSTAYPDANQSTLHNRPEYQRSNSGMPHGMPQGDGFSSLPQSSDPYPGTSQGQSMPNILPISLDPNLGNDEEFSWDMISLGLDEPLPTQDIIDDLYAVLQSKRRGAQSSSLLIRAQTSNLLREDARFCTNRTSASLSCGHESRAFGTSTCVPAVCYLVSSCFGIG